MYVRKEERLDNCCCIVTESESEAKLILNEPADALVRPPSSIEEPVPTGISRVLADVNKTMIPLKEYWAWSPAA